MLAKSQPRSGLQDNSAIRQESYQIFQRDFGFYIPKQSRNNIASLQDLLRQREVVTNGDGLTPEEAIFKKFWDAAIAPLFIAVHRTNNLSKIKKDGFLRSVTSRVRDLNNLGQANSSGRESLNRQVYFTFGLPGHLEQQHLYSESCDRVIVAAGQALDHQENPLPGLWINNHLFEYGRNTVTKGIRFGEYSRYIQYQEEGRQKHYIYYRGEEKIYSRTVSYGEEILSAEEGMHHITDGLFYLFVLDLFYLGPDAQAVLVHPVKEQVVRLFNSLYPSSEALEAKYIYKLDLCNPLVECKISTLTERLALADFHFAVAHADIARLTEHLQKNPEFVYMKDSSGATALLKTTKNWGQSKKQLEVIELLLTAGADISQDDGYNDMVQAALNHKSKLVLRLFAGIRDNLVPNMHHFIVIGQNRFHEYTSCHLAIENGYDDILQYILNRIEKFHPDDPIIVTAVEACRSKHFKNPKGQQHALARLLPCLLKKGANLEAQKNRTTALMHCAKKGDVVGIRYLVELGAKLDTRQMLCSPYANNGPVVVEADAGCTALHVAAAARQEEIVKVLLDLGADAKAVNENGLNAAQFAQVEKSKLRSKVVDDSYGLRTFLFEPKDYQAYEDKEVSRQTAGLDAIIKTLGPHVESTDIETDVDYTKSKTIINTVAMITITRFEERDYVLVVRKRDQQHRLRGHYLFPGGFLDGLTDEPVAAAKREQSEETSLQFPEPATIFKVFKFENRTHTFCIQHVTVNPSEHTPAPASDVGLACWVPIAEIDISHHDAMQIAHVNGCRFRHSNILCLQQLGYMPIEEDRDHFAQWHFEEFGLQEVAKAYNENSTEFTRCLHRGFDISQFTFMKKAVHDNNEAQVRNLVAIGSDINQMFKIGLFHSIPALALAVMSKHTQLAQVMQRELGADAAQCGTFSALGEAVRSQNEELINWCLQVTPDDAEQALGIALLICITSADMKYFQIILGKKIDVNKSYPYYAGQHSLCTEIQPLALASQYYQFGMMKLLLQAGAKVSLLQIHAWGPICYYKTELEMAKTREQLDDDSPDIHNTRTQQMMALMNQVHSAERIEQVLAILEPAAKEEGHVYLQKTF